MKITVRRIYEVDTGDMTETEFISYMNDAAISRLDSSLNALELYDAACAATELYDMGDYTHLTTLEGYEVH